jgi:hypothetical protein
VPCGNALRTGADSRTLSLIGLSYCRCPRSPARGGQTACSAPAGACMLAAMGTDVVADVLSALVAAGTLGLAGATFRLGGATSRAAVDAVSPRLVVTSLWVEEKPLAPAGVAGARLTHIPLAGTWSLRQHGNDRLGLRARGHLRSEGTVTALFGFERGPGCEVGFVTRPAGGPGPAAFAGVSLVQQDGWYVLAPGGEANFGLIWWRPLSEWAQAWQDSSQQAPTVTCRLMVRGTTGETRDECGLTFGRHVAVPHPRDDAWTIAVPGEPPGAPGYAPDTVARVGLTKRNYLRGGWLRRPWKGSGGTPQPAIAPAGQQALAGPEAQAGTEAQADPEAQDGQQAPAAGNDRTGALPAPSSPTCLLGNYLPPGRWSWRRSTRAASSPTSTTSWRPLSTASGGRSRPMTCLRRGIAWVSPDWADRMGLPGVRIFGGGPARCPQLAERRVQRIQVGGGHELVHPGGVTARSPWPGCGSRSPRRGPRPAPTSVPVRPAPAATRHGRPGSGPAAPAGLSRSAR